jgi:hypothetical protein
MAATTGTSSASKPLNRMRYSTSRGRTRELADVGAGEERGALAQQHDRAQIFA